MLALLRSLVGTQECVWCKKITYTLCEVVRLQILVSQSVLSNIEGSWWLYVFVCLCVRGGGGGVCMCVYVHAHKCVCPAAARGPRDRPV